MRGVGTSANDGVYIGGGMIASGVLGTVTVIGVAGGRIRRRAVPTTASSSRTPR